MTGSSLIAISTLGSVHGALHSTAFDVAQKLTLLLVVVFWLGLAHWVYRDARRRMDDPLLVGTATALGALVPYAGALVYLLFRPPETLEEVRSREVDVRALEQQLRLNTEHCPVCRAGVEADFRVCPVCTTPLKQPCVHCNAPLERLWLACPYCATPVVAVAEAVAENLDAALTAQAGLASRSSLRSAPPARVSARARARSAGRPPA